MTQPSNFSLETLSGFNHPKDKIEQDRKNASIYHRFVGSLDKTFKFKYHDFGPYNSLQSFNELGERKVLDDYWLPHITKDSIVVDVGASYGVYTLASALAGAVKIYAFEPVKTIADSLRKNVELNGWLDRIEVYNDLLWSSNNIGVRFDDKRSASSVQPCSSPATILSRSLDSFVGKVDLIKIDVEGVELDVLYGAISTIYRNKPRILIEMHSDFIRDLESMLNYFFDVSIQLPNGRNKFTVKERDYLLVEFD